MTDTKRLTRPTPAGMRAAAIAAMAALALACAPPRASAQWAGAIGVRIAGANDGSAANSDRNGYEGRVIYDRPLALDRLGLRGEFAYNQMQYDREDGTDRFQVAENGFELLVSARAELGGALSGMYLTGGPVASFRAACGSSGFFDSNGRVACDEGETYLTGYALGAGFQWPGQRSDFLFEFRVMGNTTAAAGRQLVALSVGMKRKGRR